MNCSTLIKLRLPGCFRPAELMDAISLGRWQSRQRPRCKRVTVSLKATEVQKQLGRRTQVGRGKMQTGRAPASRNGGLTRVDMIAAVLRRHPRRSVRELIALLDQEYRWKTTESAVTGHLYTRRDKFVHSQPDRSTNRPVTWSLK